MKMIEVFNGGGDMIRACACDLEFYAGIGWKPKAAAKVKAVVKEELE